MEGIAMVKNVYRFRLLTSAYVTTLLILGFILVAAITSLPIIRQAESQLGHTISCYEAYDYRAINDYFYPDRRLQGDVLYLYSICSPVVLFGLLALTAIVALKVLPRETLPQLKQRIILLMGIAVALFLALLAFAPV